MTIHRRTLVAGAAWAAPAVVMAAAAPAMAASYCVSRQLRFDDAGWSGIQESPVRTTSIYRQPANDKAWTDGWWESMADTLTSSTAPYRQYSITYMVPVVAGQRIQLSFDVQTSFANNLPTTSAEQRFDLTVGGTTVARGSTRARPHDPAFYTNAPVGSNGQSALAGYDNSASDVVNATSSVRADGYTVLRSARVGAATTSIVSDIYVPAETGQMALTFTFRKYVPPTTRLSTRAPYDTNSTQGGGNDKLRLSPLQITCL